MDAHEWSVFLTTTEDTQKLGDRLAAHISTLQFITLSGELGSGKTTLVRALLRASGFTGTVKSPTYTLVEIYPLPQKTIYHFDLYRIHDPEELHFMGIDDYFINVSLCLVEWPEQAGHLLPIADLNVQLDYAGDARMIHIRANTPAGWQVVDAFKQEQK